MAQTRSRWHQNVQTFYDVDHSPTNSMWRNCPITAILCDPFVGSVYVDDFFSADAHTYTSTDDAGTGSNAYVDSVNGWYNVVTAANDNDYHLMSSVAENWLFDTTNELWFEAKALCTETNVDDANLVVGLSDTLTGGFMQDNGAGPAASYDGAVWFKVDGTLAWQFETSNAGSQTTTAAAGTYASGTGNRLGFHYDPNDGTTGIITPYFDGVAGTAHNITISGLAEMHFVFGSKAGGNNAETLGIDYVKIVQTR